MKRYKKVIHLLAIVFGCIIVNIIPAHSYFFDIYQYSKTVVTSRDLFKLENLTVRNNGYLTPTIGTNIIDAGLVLPQTSLAISFDIVNLLGTELDCQIQVGIVGDWLSTKIGKFYFYPFLTSDQDILDDINNNNASNALINPGEAVVNKIITIDNQLKSGILEVIDNSTIYDYKHYQFKLFLYIESSLRNLNFSEISITANLLNNKNKWIDSTARGFLKFSCRPIITTLKIEEVGKPKNFFIEQSTGINLLDYARVVDVDNNLYDQYLIYSSYPEYNSNIPGKYLITYWLDSDSGYNATPLEIELTVWGFDKISSGNYHTLALSTLGEVYSWGYNSDGQLGDGTTAYKNTPVKVTGLEGINIVEIATSSNSSYALSDQGKIYSWGANTYGKLGNNSTTRSLIPVTVLVPEGVLFKHVASQFNIVGAISTEGDVYTWGYNGYGAAGNDSSYRVPTSIGIGDAVDLQLGYYNGAALTKDGNLYTWGDNYHGQLGQGKNASISTNPPDIVTYFSDQNIKIKGISVGWYHMIAVDENGQIYSWGYGYQGRLGNNSTQDINEPKKIDFAKPVKKVLAGYYHTGVLTQDGQVYFCGQNAYGKHGNGTTSNSLILTALPDIVGNIDLSLALDSSFVLIKYSQVYGMGYGGTGVLGNGQSSSSTTPKLWSFTPPLPF